MTNEQQLWLKGLREIPVIRKDTNTISNEITMKPRFPLIDQIFTIYNSDELEEFGASIFDDGENRVFIAINAQPSYERMLLAKVDIPEEGCFLFSQRNALLIDARYTEGTNKLTEITYKVYDLSKLNGASEDGDWISFFYESFNKEQLDEVFVEELDGKSATASVKNWWDLSLFDTENN